MFPPEFDYRRPESLDDAFAALAADDAIPLAGGHSLVPDLKARRRSPGTLVDLAALDELRGVEVTGDAVEIGALTTYAALLSRRDDTPDAIAGFLEATEAVGDRQIRNRGTVGGNLAAAEARGDLPAAALAADATLEVRNPDGTRTVPVGEFFRGDGGTALGGDELLTGVRLPRGFEDDEGEADSVGGAYAKKTHPAEGYAAVGVAARVAVAEGEIRAARLAVNGVFEAPRRLSSVESALVGGRPEDVLEGGDSFRDACGDAATGLDAETVRSDHLVSGRQRRRLLPKYTRRAVARAVARAAGSPADEGVVA